MLTQLSGDLARYRQQRRGRRGRVISRSSEASAPHCPLCAKMGFSADDSVLAHTDPDFGDRVEAEGQVYAVAEPWEEHSTRAAGLGWPSQVPMIYR